MAYDAMNESMLANAYNNWLNEHRKEQKLVVYPQATLEKYTHDGLRNAGYTVISLDCVTTAELKRAMEWYKQNTDWSAFKRKDWQAAMDSLN
ncbi:hypothetical protein AXL3_36 [Stenotrophomonas phage vB_SmaS-AXL_3]|uniref:Uncharacterized protein n=1 Tax=Stenotrophomonas phage vB_SmaS-AXL_3 TaxID=2740427 RepID=A0A7D4XK08_9CAUD|nr:hypothetical protein PQE62_gp36 [Stenotrophomonas phage vB_SmaS-AXL_3]QKW95611.1 hypothetical protein AXL3_36 [Stenotrophomonas phage vB_SmaS-AXL_3]